MQAQSSSAGRADSGRGAPASADSWPDFLPLAEACRQARISRSELYRRAARGEIAFLKLGRRVRVDMRTVRHMYERLPRAQLRPPTNGLESRNV
jgi:excisionase family DNA binding protein